MLVLVLVVLSPFFQTFGLKVSSLFPVRPDQYYGQVTQQLNNKARDTMAAANVMSSQSNPVMPKSHVGFDSITTQIERKLLKRGFQFNVICVGRLQNAAKRQRDFLIVIL